MPPFVKDSEEEIKGTVYGMYSSQELIHANATIEWYGLTLENDTAPALLFSEYTFFVSSLGYFKEFLTLLYIFYSTSMVEL